MITKARTRKLQIYGAQTQITRLEREANIRHIQTPIVVRHIHPVNSRHETNFEELSTTQKTSINLKIAALIEVKFTYF